MKGQSSEVHSAAAAGNTSNTAPGAVVSSSCTSFSAGMDRNAGPASSSTAILQLIQTSKRKIWNEIEVEEIEEEEDEEEEEEADHRHEREHRSPDQLEEHIVVIGDQSPLDSHKSLTKLGSGDSVVQCGQSHSTSIGQQNLQLQQQRVQLKRKSYSSMMSSKVMQRTVSSSSSNSYFGTVDEETDDDDDTATAKMNSSADSVQEETRTEQEIRQERRVEEEFQDFRSHQRSTARRAYARSISFSGVRSYYSGNNRYLQQQQASLARRGLIFHRLDGRTLLPSISCE